MTINLKPLLFNLIPLTLILLLSVVAGYSQEPNQESSAQLHLLPESQSYSAGVQLQSSTDLPAATPEQSCGTSCSICHLQGTGIDVNTYIPAPPILPVRTANFNVNYTGFTPEAQNAFQFAVDIWSSLLTSNVTIVLDASFESLSGGTLGQAGAFTFLSDFPGTPEPGTFYPIGLANKLAGSDQLPGDPDIIASFNSGANWYYGTDGNCPAGQYDFVSVVLHELGHGLGVQGSAQVNGSTAIMGLGLNSTPIIYDRFVRNGSNTSILDFNNGSAALLSQLTGNNLDFTGPSTVAANGGDADLFAPNPFQSGSSYSHWNENTYPAGNPNSLMTPFIGQAEVIHHPGPVALGLMEDIGWTLDNNNGGQCLATGLVITQGECQDNGNGLLPVIDIIFEIEGTCDAVDLCWGVNGATPSCANLPANGINVGDGGGVFLSDTDPDATYEFYFTTEDGQSESFFFENGNCDEDQCLPTGLVITQGECQDNGNGLLPVIEIVVEIDGDCEAVDLCWGVNGATPTCANLPDNGINIGDGGGVLLTDTDPDATYEFYFTTEDGQSESFFFENGNCDEDQCLPTGLVITQGECQDNGNGLLPVIEIVVEIDGDCEAVDLCWGVNGATPTCANLPDNGINIGDGGGVLLTDTEPNATYEFYFTTENGQSDSFFFQNGNCDEDQCLPTGLVITQGECQDNGNGLLPVIEIVVEIDGDCEAVDLCWGVNGATPTCANLPDNGINIGDGGGVLLTDTDPDATYEFYFTTEDGQSESFFFENGNCDEDQCLPTGLVITQGECQDNGNGLLPVIEIVVEIDGDCEAVDLCWGVNGATPTCANLPDNGINIGDGGGVLLTDTEPNATYEFYFTTENGQSESFFFENGNCDEDQCLPTGLVITQGECQDNGNGLLPVIDIVVEIDGDCEAVDLCWGVNGATPTCANLPDNGINIGDGGGVFLTDTEPNATYEFYFTTEDGQSQSFFFENGNCGEDIEGCTDPDALNYNPDATIDDGSCEYDCIMPTMTLTPFCEGLNASEFFIELNVTDLGNGAPYTVSNDITPSTSSISTAGSSIIGPFNADLSVTVTLESFSSADCFADYGPIEIDCPTSLDEFEALGVSVYPNPFQESLQVRGLRGEVLELAIFNALGQRVIREQISGEQSLVNTSSLLPGIYIIELRMAGEIARSSYIKN